jgi:arginine decarboxylase-like protein
LSLSARFVTAHKDVLLNAVNSYRAAILKADKWPQTVLDDPKLSLLPDLKARIESSSEIDHDPLKLLSTIVSEYQKSLMELSKERWANRQEVEELLFELNVREFREDLGLQ